MPRHGTEALGCACVPCPPTGWLAAGSKQPGPTCSRWLRFRAAPGSAGVQG